MEKFDESSQSPCGCVDDGPACAEHEAEDNDTLRAEYALAMELALEEAAFNEYWGRV